MSKQVRPPVCNYEGSDYQETFWEQADRAYEDRVEGIALRRLIPKRGVRLLEIGAGAGRNTGRYPGYDQIVLLDYSRTQLEQARQRMGASDRYIYVAADVYRLPFRPAVFDGATMIRTLHHLVEPQQALEEVRLALAPGAIFILEFANKRHVKSILRWLVRRQDWNPFSPEQIEFAELNFDFHPQTIRAHLRTAGFELGRALTVSHFRIGLLKRLIPVDLLVAVDALLQWTGGCWQLTPSVFLRSSVPGQKQNPVPGPLFCCPECGHPELADGPRGLRCKHCGLLWGVRDGIYDFREPVVEI